MNVFGSRSSSVSIFGYSPKYLPLCQFPHDAIERRIEKSGLSVRFWIVRVRIRMYVCYAGAIRSLDHNERCILRNVQQGEVRVVLRVDLECGRPLVFPVAVIVCARCLCLDRVAEIAEDVQASSMKCLWTDQILLSQSNLRYDAGTTNLNSSRATGSNGSHLK